MSSNAGLPRSRARLSIPGSASQFGDGPSTYKFGRNADVDAAEDIISQGGNLFVPAAAAATTVVSSAAGDAGSGAGLDVIQVTGLDSNWDLVTEDIDMHATDGTNAVTLTNQFLRVFRAQGLKYGSAGSITSVAAGNIDVKHGTDVLCRIPVGFVASQHAAISIPRGYVGEIRRVVVRAEGSPTLTATHAIQHYHATATGGVWHEMAYMETVDGENLIQEYNAPLVIPEMTDVKLRTLTVSAVNAVIHGGFDILIYKKL
jgi:hypothetical protein